MTTAPALTWRFAARADVPAIVALLAEDTLGNAREKADPEAYLAAFDALQREGNNHVIVGMDATGQVMATYQISFITGLSLSASRRAQIEAVRVAHTARGNGIGAALMADAEARARAAGCALMQLTTNATRTDAHRFYARLGFVPSHIGFKRPLG